MLFSLEPQERKVFLMIGNCASELGVPAYVVGGYVRDRLLGRPSKDIDVVCVGEGIKLAEQVASKLTPRPKIVVFKRFGTAMLKYEEKVICPKAANLRWNWAPWKMTKTDEISPSMPWLLASTTIHSDKLLIRLWA
jgi:hypothetical protein